MAIEAQEAVGLAVKEELFALGLNFSEAYAVNKVVNCTLAVVKGRRKLVKLRLLGCIGRDAPEGVALG